MPNARVIIDKILLLTIVFSLCSVGCTNTYNSAPQIDQSWKQKNSTETDDGINFEPVFITTPWGEKGNGARFRVRGGCVSITADHVVENTNHPVVFPMKTAFNEAVVENSDKYLDIAIIKQQHKQTNECPPLPAINTISQSIISATLREVWHVDSAGNATPLAVDLVRVTQDNIELVLTDKPASPKFFQPGMSGSVVVFDGVPVAILKHVATDKVGIAYATRLDTTIIKFEKNLPPLLNKIEKEVRVYAPYDETQLPAFYKELVKKARANKSKVERIVQIADKVKIKAQDAASIARALPKNTAINGYAHYTADNENEYAGEVYVIGNRKSAHGYGVSVSGNQLNFGDTYYCKFDRNKGCQGVGYIEWSENEGNYNGLAIWAGGFKNGNQYGFGYTQWQKTPDMKYTGEAWSSLNTNDKTPGVWKTNDGRLYEGEMTNTWEGWGVLWNDKGEIIVIGRFESGKLVEDQTEAWRSNALH